MRTLKINIINAQGKPSSATIPARVVRCFANITAPDVSSEFAFHEDLKPFFQDWVNAYSQSERANDFPVYDSQSLLMVVMQAIEDEYINTKYRIGKGFR